MKAGDGIKMANNVFQFPCEKCNFEKRECAEVAHTAQCPGLCIFTGIYTHFPNPNPIKKQYWMARRMYAYSKHIISQYEWAAHTHSTMITSHNTLNDTDLPFHAVYSTGSILFYFISLLRFKFNSFFPSLSLSSYLGIRLLMLLFPLVSPPPPRQSTKKCNQSTNSVGGTKIATDVQAHETEF